MNDAPAKPQDRTEEPATGKTPARRKETTLRRTGSIVPQQLVQGKALLAVEGQGPEYDRLRAEGYVTSLGEVTPESAAIAVPVYGAEGRVVAAIGLSGPTQRFAASAIDTMAATLKRAGAELSRLLGGTAPS